MQVEGEGGGVGEGGYVTLDKPAYDECPVNGDDDD